MANARGIEGTINPNPIPTQFGTRLCYLEGRRYFRIRCDRHGAENDCGDTYMSEHQVI